MKKIARFGVSLDESLLNHFDLLIKRKGYSCRSEALRDLIRKEMVHEAWQEGEEIAGAITLIYDHHQRELVHKLMTIQHDFGGIIISNQHIHLDHFHCLEIVAVKGRADKVRSLADTLGAAKGVKHAALSMSSTGRELH